MTYQNMNTSNSPSSPALNATPSPKRGGGGIRPPLALTAACLAALLITACSGGGTAPEAVVQTLSDAQTLEGNTGTTPLEFSVTLDKPALAGLDIIFSTVSTAKPGYASTGSAVGGSSCAPGINFINAVNTKVSIPGGASTGKLTVLVCGNTVFGPNQTLKVVWRSAGAAGGGGSANGKIINDDAGGLNSTGALSVLSGLPAFGRDTNSLTNSAADGALGFSFVRKDSLTNWNCTYDQVTGLTWQRLDTANGTNKNFASLGAYVDSVNASSPCGHTDWRVPSVNELISLMDASQPFSSAPNADRLGTQDAMMGQFWSGESVASASNNAWLVDTDNGGAASFDAKSGLKNVRLVQGPPSPASGVCSNVNSQYQDFTDGTVADNQTGLMWKQCAEGISGSNCSVGTAVSLSTIPAIVARLNAVNADASASGLGLGYADWRVPNKNELASLVNRSCTANANANNPAILASAFPATGAVAYTSATLDANDNTRLWYVDFADGSVAVGHVSVAKNLRLVRAGQ